MKKSQFSTNISLYLGNDTRQSHTYYGRQTGNCTQAFEWCHFRWPWVTSPILQGHDIIQRQELANGTMHLQWPTIRKSYNILSNGTISITMNDPQPRFQGHAILWRWTYHNTNDARSLNLLIFATGWAVCGWPQPGHESLKALRHGSHRFTCNYTTACLYLISIHKMAPPQTEVVDI